jgi:hypothetical protein
LTPSLSQSLAQASALSGLTSVNPSSNGNNSQTSWYEALAAAWGSVLNGQANDIATLSNTIGTGANDPASITNLTAKTLEFSFDATSASTSITEAGDGLKQLGQK